MANQDSIDDSLLGKYLAGETNEAETEQVQQWLLRHNPTNGENHQREFDRLQQIWESSAVLKSPAAAVDTEAAWHSVKSKLGLPAVQTLDIASEAKVIPIKRRNFWPAAAAILVVFGLCWFMFNPFGQAPQQVATATEQALEQHLPDGSTVLLNRGSQLTYPQRFEKGQRVVQLKGEGFFDITPNPSQPFIIEANGTTVRVVGTSFSVRAYNSNVRVAVRTGKVLFTAMKKEVSLVKNQQASFDSASHTIETTAHLNPNVFAYKTGKLIFEKTPLSEVIETLREVYQADIQLANDRLKHCQLNVPFDTKDSLDTILKVIADSFQLHIRQNGNQIILDGTGC
ncbi:FecR domain-containing protein [Siphonobacter sp. SORGH_AS_1065]|uniref:FecR domain-containing protein n=1 Tax=Siphonobacter sp. SORGH_AS_1065 TaxID=3041795 RepID=UPI00278991C9|nr:FecR domain-containing protein [Siphonobacter sp. SORGH_AS_1065]MDQ1090343.1 transmembrane sensor [Siphonobacter sp. SORGH_AS_1065]